MKNISVGIDLGTTYSSIAHYDINLQNSQSILDSSQKSSIPSVVAIDNGKINVGYSAKNSNTTLLYDSKRLIGKTFTEASKMTEEKQKWSFEIIKDNNDEIKMKSRDNGIQQSFYPEEISSYILKELISMFNKKYPNSTIGKIVVTVPHSFTEKEKNATKRACKLSNMENVELLHEPCAGILQYKNEFKLRNSKILVIDFGGGTLDISFCELKGDDVKVLSNGGDENLGGNDFDRIIYDMILEEMVDNDLCSKLDFYAGNNELISEKKKKAMNKLKMVSEEIKIKLSREDVVQIPLEKVLEKGYDDCEIYIERESFEKKCKSKNLIRRFRQSIQNVLDSNYYSKNDVDFVLPIGGSNYIPIIENEIISMFGSGKMANRNFDKLTAVSKGAALRAYQLTLHGESQIIPINLYDKLTHSIGFLIYGEIMERVVEKNDTFPIVDREKIFYPVANGQPEVEFIMMAGEGMLRTDDGMRILGRLKIPLPQNTMKNQFEMKTYVSIDRSGMIHVKVIRTMNGQFLGEMKVQLDVSDLDKNINEMKQHMKIFKCDF